MVSRIPIVAWRYNDSLDMVEPITPYSTKHFSNLLSCAVQVAGNDRLFEAIIGSWGTEADWRAEMEEQNSEMQSRVVMRVAK